MHICEENKTIHLLRTHYDKALGEAPSCFNFNFILMDISDNDNGNNETCEIINQKSTLRLPQSC
jgi:hypothetical protein